MLYGLAGPNVDFLNSSAEMYLDRSIRRAQFHALWTAEIMEMLYQAYLSR